MESVNPFLDKHQEYEDTHRKILEFQHQIDAIKRDLERKTKMLIESRANHKKTMEEKAKALISTCNHLNKDGSPAIDKKNENVLMRESDKLVTYSYCQHCGHKFKTGETKITPTETQKIIDNSVDYIFEEEADSFLNTLTFDPNFDNEKFFTDTQNYYISAE